jgi:hypothetical protein
VSAGTRNVAPPSGPAPRGPRVTASRAIEGQDRCDPQNNPRDAAADPACQQVLETRSAEFVRPDPAELSPEQRLLAQERAGAERATGSDARRVARQVMGTDTDDESAAQALASVSVSQSQQRPQETEQPSLSAETQALINAIVAGAGGGAVPPTVLVPGRP